MVSVGSAHQKRISARQSYKSPLLNMEAVQTFGRKVIIKPYVVSLLYGPACETDEWMDGWMDE